MPPKKVSQLSAYTSAKNCTDISDCKNGIKEIQDYMDYKTKMGHKIPNSVYIKYYRLRKKLEKFEKK